MKIFFSFFLAGSLAFAASLANTQLRGEYVEARTADVWTGPCFANSEVGLTGELAVMGWKVEKGVFDGVDLAGLAVMGVVRASHTLGDTFHTSYPVKAVMIVDEKANPEQQLALRRFAQRMSGDLLQDVVRTYARPIAFSLDGSIHDRKATMIAGDLAKLQTRAIEERDAICHSNEGVWYTPLTTLDHAMPAVAIVHQYKGGGLNTTWSSPDKRSAFVGTFVLPN
jgi:hypothetical protein